MRKRLLFLFLVTFFTIFGAGRSHDWRFLVADKEGWSYSVDRYSVEASAPHVIECIVLATHQRGARIQDRWRLDAQNRLLTRRSLSKAEPILHGSVADQAILYFRKNGDLPINAGGVP